MKQRLYVHLTALAFLFGAAYPIAGYPAKASYESGGVASGTMQDQAVAFYEARLAALPDDPGAYRMLANALVNRAKTTGDAADYDRAWQILEHAESIEPGSLHLLQAGATLLLSRHRFGQARLLAEQGLRKDPNNGILLGIAGDSALQMGDLEEAEAYYRKFTAIEPKLLTSWAKLSYLAEIQGRLGEAAELMEKGINAGYPKPLSTTATAWARAILGQIEAKRGNLKEARRQYQWALHKSPEHPLAMEFLADLQQWQGDFKSAETGYRKLLALKPDPNIKVRLAELLEKREAKREPVRLRAEAYKFYQRAVASGNEGYLRPLAILELAAGRYQRAAALAARDTMLRPTAEGRAIHKNIVKAAERAGHKLATPSVSTQPAPQLPTSAAKAEGKG